LSRCSSPPGLWIQRRTYIGRQTGRPTPRRPRVNTPGRPCGRQTGRPPPNDPGRNPLGRSYQCTGQGAPRTGWDPPAGPNKRAHAPKTTARRKPGIRFLLRSNSGRVRKQALARHKGRPLAALEDSLKKKNPRTIPVSSVPFSTLIRNESRLSELPRIPIGGNGDGKQA
jgi:hypothetical protein